MQKMKRFVVVLAVVIVASLALTACAPQTPTAVEPAKEQVDQQTSQDQATVDEALNSAQAKVSDLAAAAGGLEARISGLQVNSDLQELQRKLTAAIGDAGDKKKQGDRRALQLLQRPDRKGRGGGRQASGGWTCPDRTG